MNRLLLIVQIRPSFCKRYISSQLRPFCFHDLVSTLHKKKLLLPLSHNGPLLTSITRINERHVSFLTRIKNRVKASFKGSTKARLSGNLVYEKIADGLDYKKFLQHFELPDTFQSWFMCIQLHMWMVILVTVPERHGREFRNALIDAMWNDIEIRIGQVAKMKSSDKKKYLTELVGQFQATLVSFDEGIHNDDTVLAAAAWRTIFACKIIDPRLLELSVFYIRRQLDHLDLDAAEKIIMDASLSFLPLQTIISEIKEH